MVCIGNIEKNRRHKMEQIIKEVVTQSVNPTESSWFAIDVSKLPLHTRWVEKLTKLGKGAFILMERKTEGGETHNTNCCVTQGQQSGLMNLIPLPTHRAMFVGQADPKTDTVSVTFRYISNSGLMDLTSGENTPIEFEWVDKLPCFPRALAIQEIPEQLSDEDFAESALHKGVFVSEQNEFYNHTPIAFPHDDADDDCSVYWKNSPSSHAYVMSAHMNWSEVVSKK